MAKMNFDKKGLIELLEFAEKDWKKEAPTLKDDAIFNDWKIAVMQAVPKANLGDLIRARDMLSAEEDYLLELGSEISNAIESFVCVTLEDRVDRLEESIEVLLKQHAKEPANITVEQLNKLKGGYQ